jgi:uncharacterized protein YdeI (YjbR/CyaY-like superfamily)
VDTGDRIEIMLRRAPTDLPVELATLLRTNTRASAAWARLTTSQQRMLREEIARARQSPTRLRRARQVLLGT